MLFHSPVLPILPQTTKRHHRCATTVALLDSTVKVFHDDSLKFFLSLYGHKLPVMSMDISDDGALLATGSADKTVKIWGLDFGDCHRSLLAHDDSIMVSFAILCRCCAIWAIPWTGFRLRLNNVFGDDRLVFVLFLRISADDETEGMRFGCPRAFTVPFAPCCARCTPHLGGCRIMVVL